MLVQDDPAIWTPGAKKASHQANIVRISEVLPHPDPETTSLELIHIDGYQVVVRKDQFTVGDLAVYIQPDSVVPQTEPFRFIWEGQVGVDGIVPEKRRRITVRKFRKEWSEGLLLPVREFAIDIVSVDDKPTTFGVLDAHGKVVDVYEGDDVSSLLGITHYDPDASETTRGAQAAAPKRKFRYPRTIRGWFNFIKRLIVKRGRLSDATVDVPVQVPTYDVDAFKNYKHTFVPGEIVVVTEKVHGSNARFLYLDGAQYAGSRNQWKAKDASSTWWKALVQNPWIAEWCEAHPGHVLWGEVTPTQKGYTYGAKSGEVKFFVFDVYTPEGTWVSYDNLSSVGFCRSPKQVPILYYGPYDEEKILKLVDGPSFVNGSGHIREGVVVKTAVERSVRGLGRAQLKIVSNDFLAKDSK
jgi:hypothetical protein